MNTKILSHAVESKGIPNTMDYLFPTEQQGGDPLWTDGNTGLRDKLFDIYAAEEFQTGGPSVSDILKRRGVDSVEELLEHLQTRPILVTKASFSAIQHIQPFNVSGILGAIGSVGNLQAITGPAVVKILLEADALPVETRNELLPFLRTLYLEEVVKSGSQWRPAPMDDQQRRQIALMAFLHGLHALASVTVVTDPTDPRDRIPDLQATLPARYTWLTKELDIQSSSSESTIFGLQRPDIGHFAVDMFDSLGVPLSSDIAGEFADTHILVKRLHNPTDLWRRFVELQDVPTGVPPPAYTPRGFNTIATPAPSPSAPDDNQTVEFIFEDLPRQAGFTLWKILNSLD